MSSRVLTDVHDLLLTPGEVASKFRVDPKTVTRWAKAGRIDSIRTPGGHRRFRESQVRALLMEQGSTEYDGPLFLLWSQKHHAWWRTGGFGYTKDQDQAGRFTQEEAVASVVRSAIGNDRFTVTFMVGVER